MLRAGSSITTAPFEKSRRLCNGRPGWAVFCVVADFASAKGDSSITADSLYRAHALRLVGVAYLICGSRSVAEDVVHDVFASAQSRLAVIENPSAYLRRAVVNRCLQWRGREAMRRLRTPAPGSDRVDAVYDEILDVLWKLPNVQRVALVLRFYEDLSSDDIAQLMEIPASTVRSHVRRGLMKLKEMLADE
jgi:RNA polymerase sigma factor (sigma-70 family)